MRIVALDESARAVFNAAGRAEVRLGPQRFGESWEITLTAISTTSTSVTAFKLYRTRESPSALLDKSDFNGNGDVSDSQIKLSAQEQLVGVWTGGSAGAVGTVTVSGDRTLRGR